MNAQMKALVEEQEHLNTLMFNLINQEMPFQVSIGNLELPESVKTKARFGMSSYITMRLREIHAAIAELKKEKSA